MEVGKVTLTTPWVIGIAVVLAAAVGLGGYEWLQEHDARLKSESVQVAQQQVIATAQKTIDQSKAEQVKINADLAAQLAAIAAERKTVPTPQQVVIDVSKLLPNLPAPVAVQQVAATPATPTAPAQAATQQIVIPQADIPAFQAYKLNCDESSARLLACTTNAQAVSEQLAATQSQYKAEEVRAASWEATAKGGTWWHRTLTAAKWIGIGGATGYLAGRFGK